MSRKRTLKQAVVAAFALSLCIAPQLDRVEAQPSATPPPAAEESHPGHLEILETDPEQGVRRFEVTWEELPNYSPDFCPIPIEGVVVSGPHAHHLDEDDLFESGFEIDLNGDGDLDDEFVMTRLEHANWATEHARNRQFVRPPVQLSENGPSFVVYNYSPEEASIGLPLPGYPLGLLSGPNPCLQIMLFEPVEAPGVLPKLQLKGMGNWVQTWSRERRLLGDDLRWYSLQWGVIEPDTPFHFEVHGPVDQDQVILVRPNYAPVEGFRVRGRPALIRMVGGQVQ